MKTQHDIEQEQQGGPSAPISHPTQPTVQEASWPPAQVFPRPPQQPPRPRGNRWVVIGAVVLALVLMLSASIDIELTSSRLEEVRTDPPPEGSVPHPLHEGITLVCPLSHSTITRRQTGECMVPRAKHYFHAIARSQL